jgi:hypothetical protein
VSRVWKSELVIGFDELVKDISECNLLILLDSAMLQNLDNDTPLLILWGYIETILVELSSGYEARALLYAETPSQILLVDRERVAPYYIDVYTKCPTSPVCKTRNAYQLSECTVVLRNRTVSIGMQYILGSLWIHLRSRDFCDFR